MWMHGLYWDEVNFCFRTVDDFGNLYTLSYSVEKFNVFYNNGGLK